MSTFGNFISIISSQCSFWLLECSFEHRKHGLDLPETYWLLVHGRKCSLLMPHLNNISSNPVHFSALSIFIYKALLSLSCRITKHFLSQQLNCSITLHGNGVMLHASSNFYILLLRMTLKFRSKLPTKSRTWSYFPDDWLSNSCSTLYWNNQDHTCINGCQWLAVSLEDWDQEQ